MSKKLDAVVESFRAHIREIEGIEALLRHTTIVRKRQKLVELAGYESEEAMATAKAAYQSFIEKLTEP